MIRQAHAFMVKGDLVLTIPNPHGRDREGNPKGLVWATAGGLP